MLDSTKNFIDQQTEYIHIQKVDSYSPLLVYLLRRIIMNSLYTQINLYSQLFANANHKSITKTVCTNTKFVSYNGCFALFSKNKSEIALMQAQIIKFFNNLGIRFTVNDIKIVNLDQGFTFLGFYIKRNLDAPKEKLLDSVTIKPSARSQLALLRRVRNILYHKDYLQRVRPSTHLSFRLAGKKVDCVVRKWKHYYRSYMVCTTTYKQLSKALQAVLYKWQIKKYQKKSKGKVLNSLHKKLRINNLLINVN
uniref:Group II intron maturase-specific domain-containing protein n=1 Tax=Hildenbrandia rivularis TaxID=135206 RepID=A0A1C9CFG3_9FLOR|nr:hypothetical protein Hrvl_055 [Hildenbrandia rivularis]AOM67115.1 hypothetical protein Hrvl_055 [Hildenbrandia rivularis]